MGEVIPTVLKTEAGTDVSWATVVGLAACQFDEALAGDPLPLATLMMTRAATTTTTRPTASHVNSPAGRPPRAGLRAALGRWLVGFFVATVLL
jgi:hypothetical protein